MNSLYNHPQYFSLKQISTEKDNFPFNFSIMKDSGLSQLLSEKVIMSKCIYLVIRSQVISLYYTDFTKKDIFVVSLWRAVMTLQKRF